jgi:hypothetical protein
MRKASIGPLPDYFVTYDDSKGRYTEVNFDVVAYIKRLAKRNVEAELWTRTRVFPEVK